MSNSEERVRRPRITDSTSCPSGATAISALPRDPRRAVVVGRQAGEITSQYLALVQTDSPESSPAPSLHSASAATKHLRKHPQSQQLASSSRETLQAIPPDFWGSGTFAASHSSQTTKSTIRPLSIPQKSPSHSVIAPDKVRMRKENGRAASADFRQLKQPMNALPLRAVSGGDLSLMSEGDKAGLGLAVEGKLALAGPIASANWEHMQREVEHLRRTVQEFHKVTRKQAKRIEELTTQATSHHKAMQDKDEEIASLREKCSKAENHLSSVEGAVQCQICMDLPDRPYTLSPCGHVLCLSCLQEWFKTSLGPIEEEEDDVDAAEILNRDKTCPSCRTVVRHRPCPAFMVKEVISTFSKAAPPLPTPPTNGAGNVDDDPWAGIFPDSDEEECAIDEFSDDEDDFGIDFSWMANNRNLAPGFATWTYGTDSDDGAYSEDEDHFHEEPAGSDGSISEEDYGEPAAYVEPTWEPPTVHMEPNSYNLEGNDNALSLLRRGCTWDMVQNFHIRYSHRHGIVISLRSIDELYMSDDELDSSDEEADQECIHHIYLGWNITLEEEDNDGEAFMHGVLADIKENPERWRLVPRYDEQGSMDVTRLVLAESREDYSDTDTENYLEHEDRDMDID